MCPVLKDIQTLLLCTWCARLGDGQGFSHSGYNLPHTPNRCTELAEWLEKGHLINVLQRSSTLHTHTHKFGPYYYHLCSVLVNIIMYNPFNYMFYNISTSITSLNLSKSISAFNFLGCCII